MPDANAVAAGRAAGSPTSAASTMTNPSLIGPARDRASRSDPAVHDHLCGVYDSVADEHERACDFVRVGLASRQQCLYIAERLTPAEFGSMLEARGIDVQAAMRDGALLVLPGAEVRRTIGGFTPESMLAFLARAEGLAIAAGFTAFRLTADMTWLRQDGIAPTEMFRYESLLNTFFEQHQIVGLCQYAVDAFPAELLIAGVETHPLLAYNRLVCDNFYFTPPEEFLQPQFPETRLKRMLSNVVSRERLMERMLSH